MSEWLAVAGMVGDRLTATKPPQKLVAVSWARTAYKFSKMGNMKYGRAEGPYPIDGQPRVSYSGLVWARYVGDFVDGSKVSFNVLSEQPSHEDAEEQLTELYGRFLELDGLQPAEVFRKFL